MKQILSVLSFEFMNYARQKSFRILTIILVLAVGVVFSWDRIEDFYKDMTSSGEPIVEEVTNPDGTPVEPQTGVDESEIKKIAVVDKTEGEYFSLETYNEAFKDTEYQLSMFSEDNSQLEKDILDGKYAFGLVIEGPLSYKRIVRSIGMIDRFYQYFEPVMLNFYRYNAMTRLGIPETEIGEIIGSSVSSEVQILADGKNQEQSFIYTYALVFLLYFAIMVYGQIVSSSVATEKSTRAMELLITSAKTNNLMFGKVLGAGAAGIVQLLLILGSGVIFYNLNSEYYSSNMLMDSIFSMSGSLIFYTILFFLLGFFLYAFLYASLASLVSRMEELASAVMPVTFIFIGAFMITMLSMGSGSIDSTVMKICSFIPLTSPMAMFARISMGEVRMYEIVISVAILILSNIGAGLLAAKIYRLGVLLYGNPPKIKNIIKMLRNS